MGYRQGDMFPSKWMKAEDFEDGERKTVTIEDVAREEFTNRQQGGKPETKFVVQFRKEKPLVLNKTNADVLFKLLGEDTDDWIGQRILLMVKEVDAYGETFQCVRVLPQLPSDGAKSGPRPAPQNRYEDEDEAEPLMTSEQRDRIIELAAIEWRDQAERKAQMQKLLPRRLDELSEAEADGVIATIEKPPARKGSSPRAQSEPDDFDDSDPFADE